MPPFFPQAPLGAPGAAGAPTWLHVAMTALAVASEPWALGLIAVALYSWLERQVSAVLAAAAPLLVALAASGGLAVAARALWAAPRIAGTGVGLGVLRHLVPGAQVLGLAAFAAYSLLAYGRRAALVLVLAGLGIAARVHAGVHWGADLAGGGLAGATLGALAYLVAVRLFPGGHLARARAGRSRPGPPAA